MRRIFCRPCNRCCIPESRRGWSSIPPGGIVQRKGAARPSRNQIFLDCGGNPAEREPRRFGISVRSRKAVSPLRSSLRCASPRQAATAVQIFVVRARSCMIVVRIDTDLECGGCDAALGNPTEANEAAFNNRPARHLSPVTCHMSPVSSLCFLGSVL